METRNGVVLYINSQLYPKLILTDHMADILRWTLIYRGLSLWYWEFEPQMKIKPFYKRAMNKLLASHMKIMSSGRLEWMVFPFHHTIKKIEPLRKILKYTSQTTKGFLQFNRHFGACWWWLKNILIFLKHIDQYIYLLHIYPAFITL